MNKLSDDTERMEVLTKQLVIIPIWEYDGIAARAAEGDASAEVLVRAIRGWATSANELEETGGATFTCIACHRPITKGEKEGEGNVIGWAVVLPSKTDPHGATGAVCYHCAKLGSEKLMQAIMASLSDTLDADVRLAQ